MLREVFTRARNRSVPLMLVVTPDPMASERELAQAVNGSGALSWDLVRGLHEPSGVHSGLADSIREADDPTRFAPVAFCEAVHRMPSGAVAFGHQFDRWLNGSDGPAVIQAVRNLRNEFKVNQRMLVMFACSHALPPELKDDVLVVDEPLPTTEQLEEVVGRICKAAKSDCPTFVAEAEDVRKAAVRVTGLSEFAAEQAVAMSSRAAGIDHDDLWSRKRKIIEMTPGLSVYGGSERFSDIKGLSSVVTFLRRVIAGKRRPNVIVMVDEIEKAIAGSQGDTSGVSQGLLQCLLTEMQDQEYTGCIFIGPPGSGKTAVTKATGNEAEVPTIMLDLNGLKGSLVGESERQMRDALKVIRAVGTSKALWLATCNEITSLPSALRRRFTLGTYFFDLPTTEESEAIWSYYLGRYTLSKKQRAALPPSYGWTGAEIKQCVDNAWALDITLLEAAEYVVPVARSAAQEINRLRQEASGRFLSASKPGVYRSTGEQTEGGHRTMMLSGANTGDQR